MRSGGNEIQTGVGIFNGHWIPLDLLCAVLLLQKANTHPQMIGKRKENRSNGDVCANIID